MVKSEPVEIRGRIYTITTLTYTRASPVFACLVRVLGPSVGELVASGGKLDPLALGRMLAYASERFTAADLDLCVKAFAASTQVDGKDLAKSYDSHFAGNFGELREWISACVVLNFADFLGGVGSETP